MKYCPKCHAEFGYDMSFCLEDGTPLQISENQAQTEHFGQPPTPGLLPTPSNFESEKFTESFSEKTVARPQTGYTNEETVALPPNSLPPTVQSADIAENNPQLSVPTVLRPPLMPPKTQSSPSDGWRNNQIGSQPERQSVLNQSTPLFQYEAEPQRPNMSYFVGITATALFLIGTAVGGILYFQSPSSRESSSLTTGSNITKTPSQIVSPGSNPGNIFSQGSDTDKSTNRSISNSTEKTTSKTTPATEDTSVTKQDSQPPPKKPDSSSTGSPPVPKVVSGGVVNGKAVNLVKPPYPPAARAVRASGAVNVQVTIDEEGNVISASAVSGHPLLKSAAEQAARASKFSPMVLSGQKVKVTGVIVYNFTAQ